MNLLQSSEYQVYSVGYQFISEETLDKNYFFKYHHTVFKKYDDQDTVKLLDDYFLSLNKEVDPNKYMGPDDLKLVFIRNSRDTIYFHSNAIFEMKGRYFKWNKGGIDFLEAIDPKYH